MKRSLRGGVTALAVLVGAGCASGQSDSPSDDAGAPAVAGHNVLSPTEIAEGWELLFDGESLAGWRAYDRPELPGSWDVVAGLLTRTGPGGDLMTERVFRDFELMLEWRVEERGNSGIFYLAAQGEENIYHSAPEMQVLDDERHPDGQSELTSAGAKLRTPSGSTGCRPPRGRMELDPHRRPGWSGRTLAQRATDRRVRDSIP